MFPSTSTSTPLSGDPLVVWVGGFVYPHNAKGFNPFSIRNACTVSISYMK